ncbi:MAG: hypothetical protein WCK76_00015 [Elusimicrobiota bacterium]
MSYQISKTGAPPYILIQYLGEVSSKDLLDAVAEAAKLSQDSGLLLFLADCSRMSVGHSELILRQVLNIIEQSKIPPAFKEAILLPEAGTPVESARLYETTARNRGYNVRLFESKEDALKWLLA